MGSVIKPLLNNTKTGGDVSVEPRNILHFNGVDIYGALAAPVTFTGDFEVEVVCSIPNVAGYGTWLTPIDSVLGRATTRSTLSINSDGATIAYVLGGTTVSGAMAGGVTPYDGKLHTWKLRRVGSTGSITIDGITQLSGAASAVTTQIDLVGVDQSILNWFAGEILSVKFTDNSGADPKVTTYILDNGSTTYQQAKGYTLGDHIITGDDSTFDTSLGNWVDHSELTGSTAWNAAGYMELINGGSSSDEGIRTLTLSLVVGETYHLTASRSVANSIIQLGTTGWGSSGIYQSNNGVGDIDIYFVATASTVYLTARNFNSTGTAVVDNFTLRASPNTMIYNNVASTDWEAITYNNLGRRWEGEDRVVDGGFDTACGVNWVCGSAAITIAGGVMAWDGTQITADSSYTAPIYTAGARYLVTYTITERTAGSVRPDVGGSGALPYASTIGVHSGVQNASGGSRLYMQGDVNFIGSIDNVSSRQVWEY